MPPVGTQNGVSTIATASILLIRHAAHEHLGKVLSGRAEGLALSSDGRMQADALAVKLAGNPPDRIETSPVQRARETAISIAEACGRSVEVVEALNEVDFGKWTGVEFTQLANDARWRNWNLHRAEATPPSGESMSAAQLRAWGHVRGTASRHPAKTVAMITHCDIIRAVVAAVLGLSLDRILSFDIDPASVSRITIGEWGARITSLNEVAV